MDRKKNPYELNWTYGYKLGTVMHHIPRNLYILIIFNLYIEELKLFIDFNYP